MSEVPNKSDLPTTAAVARKRSWLSFSLLELALILLACSLGFGWYRDHEAAKPFWQCVNTVSGPDMHAFATEFDSRGMRLQIIINRNRIWEEEQRRLQQGPTPRVQFQPVPSMPPQSLPGHFKPEPAPPLQ